MRPTGCRLAITLSASSWASPRARIDSATPRADEIEIWLALDGQAVARFRFTDRLRAESAEVVRRLRASGLVVHLLSGDQNARVPAVARTLGIERARGEAHPADKLAFVRELQRQGRRVLMVGDGINDAPVLAGADVSVAVGQASALASIAADGVLLGGRLEQLNALHALAHQTRRIIRQNLSWAMAYNLLAIPLAALGWVSAWVAALGMSLSSLLVAGNALRLLPRARPAQKAETMREVAAPSTEVMP
jgi:Cu2+-exporting ATPase